MSSEVEPQPPEADYVSGLTKPIQWWVQLIGSSPLEKYAEIRLALRWLTGAPICRFVWADSDPAPTAIDAQGYDAPPAVYKVLCEDVQPLLADREYMIFLMMVTADILDRSAINCFLVTKNIVAEVNGDELIDRAKALVQDADEEIETGLDS